MSAIAIDRAVAGRTGCSLARASGAALLALDVVTHLTGLCCIGGGGDGSSGGSVRDCGRDEYRDRLRDSCEEVQPGPPRLSHSFRWVNLSTPRLPWNPGW